MDVTPLPNQALPSVRLKNIHQIINKMDKKVHIRICVGTYSYIMGGAELMNLKEEIPEHFQDKLKIDAVVSLPNCDEKTMKPPFVEINGELMCEANYEKILRKMESLIEKNN